MKKDQRKQLNIMSLDLEEVVDQVQKTFGRTPIAVDNALIVSVEEYNSLVLKLNLFAKNFYSFTSIHCSDNKQSVENHKTT